MGTTNCYDGVDEYAVRIIKFKARQLVGQAGFTDSDRNDLEQEMVIDLLRRLPKFDPSKARRNTFIARIVEHKVATLIEAQTAGVRDYRRYGFSLNERIEYEEGKTIERSDTISQDDYLRRTGRKSTTAQETVELAVDLDVFLNKLPPQLRSLCDRLAAESLTAIATETGVPRSTLYEAVKKLRRLLREAGFDEYL